MTPGDTVLVTMPRSAVKQLAEYVEDRGSRVRVLIQGELATRIVLRERVRAVVAKASGMGFGGMEAVIAAENAKPPKPARDLWVNRGPTGIMTPEGGLVAVDVPSGMAVTSVDHEARVIVVGTPPRDTAYYDALREASPALRAVPKPPKPWRSDAYMAHVRTFECCGCGMRPVEAHHHGPHAMGQKTDDSRCIPLCARCHRGYHDTGKIPSILAEYQDEVTRAAQVECLRAWFTHKEIDADAVIVEALTSHLRESA